MPKNGKSGPHCLGREGSTQFAQQLESAVTAPPLVGCVIWSPRHLFFYNFITIYIPCSYRFLFSIANTLKGRKYTNLVTIKIIRAYFFIVLTNSYTTFKHGFCTVCCLISIIIHRFMSVMFVSLLTFLVHYLIQCLLLFILVTGEACV